jgi:cytochrome c oxidase assembly factor CtaG
MMSLHDFPWLWLLLVGFAVSGWLYIRGWLRLREISPTIAKPEKLFAFWLAAGVVLAVFISPLYTLSEQLLFGRALQMILICLVAPPLVWLAAPVHTIAWGAPGRLRRRFTRQLLETTTTRNVVRTLSAPGLTWLLFIGAFLIWHDPQFVDWSMRADLRHHLALALLLGAALLYWGHVVRTGPRIHRRLPGWVYFAYLIGADIPNMISGVTIAFNGQPIYNYYAAVHAAADYRYNINVLADQTIAGGIIWCFGSIIYFGSAVLVIRKLFKDSHRDGMPSGPQPFPNWDSDERMIAPGLEHRVIEKRWRELQ